MPAHDNQVPFEAHVELLLVFITHRDAIVERIQGILNAPQKLPPHQQDRALLARQFEDCFFAPPGVPRELSGLRGQLQRAHWADGFKPRDMPGIPNEMFDPADMMERAFTVWRNTRWPGRNGRIRYAQTLFNLHVVRCLTLLDMRLCDAGPAGAGERVKRLQAVLDALWKSSPLDQPVLVRDVRWLVPVAQSPTTDDLGPYFEAARKFEECLPETDRFEIHKASLLMAGGHLRSQLRHFVMQGRSLEDKALTSSTRGSNALDCAMTIQHLVPLLAAYEQAIRGSEAGKRRELAGAICQGLSGDPELFLNHLDLLCAYSMIEHLFVTDAGGQVVLTPMGQRHFHLSRQYVALIQRLAESLHEDCSQFRPMAGTYSPYGVMFGFSSNILEHMTLKALQPDAATRFSLEDVFTDEGLGAERLAWVSGWRKLPHVPQAVQKLYEYPQQFAAEIFDRLEQAFRNCARGEADAGDRSGRLRLDAPGSIELSPEYLLSTDPQVIATGKAQTCETGRLLGNRLEGMYLVSYQTPGGWVAISKDVLTGILAAGEDVKLGGLPHAATQVLRVMYPDLVDSE